LIEGFVTVTEQALEFPREGAIVIVSALPPDTAVTHTERPAATANLRAYCRDASV